MESNDDNKSECAHKRSGAAELNALCDSNASMPDELLEFSDASETGSEIL
jgi:hypothetical protein